MIDQAPQKRSDVSAVPYLHQRERTIPARLLEDLSPGGVARAFVWVDTSSRCAPEALAVVCAVAKEQNSVLLVYEQNPNGQTHDRAGGRSRSRHVHRHIVPYQRLSSRSRLSLIAGSWSLPGTPGGC